MSSLKRKKRKKRRKKICADSALNGDLCYQVLFFSTQRGNPPAALLTETLLHPAGDHHGSLGVELAYLVPPVVVLRDREVGLAPLRLAPRRLLAHLVDPPRSPEELLDGGGLPRGEVCPPAKVEPNLAHAPIVLVLDERCRVVFCHDGMEGVPAAAADPHGRETVWAAVDGGGGEERRLVLKIGGVVGLGGGGLPIPHLLLLRLMAAVAAAGALQAREGDHVGGHITSFCVEAIHLLRETGNYGIEERQAPQTHFSEKKRREDIGSEHGPPMRESLERERERGGGLTVTCLNNHGRGRWYWEGNIKEREK